MSTEQPSDTKSAGQPAFRVAQVFLQRAVFVHRGLPLALPENTPQAAQEISVTVAMQHLDDNTGPQVATQVTVIVATNPEDGDTKALYDFVVEMNVLVHDVDRVAFPDHQLTEVAAAMLYPFVREAVANITGRGRFGPVWLNPFNVRAALGDAFKAKLEAAAAEAEKQNPVP
jgi:preprotein translocase subunit SecB